MCICVCAGVCQGGSLSREVKVKVWEVVGELIKPGEGRKGDVKLSFGAFDPADLDF